MIDRDWVNIKYFTPKENWGDLSILSANLVHELDLFRGLVDSAIVVTCGTQGVHVADSNHPKGFATDVVFPDKPISQTTDLLIAATRFRFTGIGVYKAWKYDGREVVGMHLELVPEETTMQRKYWLGIFDGKGGDSYVALSSENIKKYGLI